MERNQGWNKTPGTRDAEDLQDPLWQVLDEWKAPQPGSAFDNQVMARIREEEFAQTSRNSSWKTWFGFRESGRGWAVSAALATVLFAGVLLRTPQDLAPAPEPTTGMEFSAQQVEMALDDLRMLDELYGSTGQEDGQSDRL